MLTVCVTPDFGNHGNSEEPARWAADCEDGLFQQSDNTWTAFSQDSSDQRQGAVGRWWPSSTDTVTVDMVT